ncbi:response regulator transcription factor [Oryzihumus sp.]
MSPYLAPFRVSEAAETLYRRILRSSRSDVATHAAELGWTLEEVTTALQSLIAIRLVRETTDHQVVVEHPRAALERLIDSEEARLDSRRRELSEARNAIAQFAADHRVGQSDSTATRRPAWEEVSAQLAPSLVEHTIRITSGVIRTSVVRVDVGPGLDDDTYRTAQAAVAAGREQRALYPLSALEDPASQRWMRGWSDVGEQQRVTDSPPSEFAVFGDEVVLAVASWHDPTSDFVVIRDEMLVSAFTTMFDLAWSVALPVPDASVETDADRRLLTLLAGGLKDEAIARYLGWGVRTVRRRVANLMADLGADTRFQLGVAAQRRGLIGAARGGVGPGVPTG